MAQAKSDLTVKCPNCGETIDVPSAVREQADKEVRRQAYEEARKEARREAEEQLKALSEEVKAHAAKEAAAELAKKERALAEASQAALDRQAKELAQTKKALLELEKARADYDVQLNKRDIDHRTELAMIRDAQKLAVQEAIGAERLQLQAEMAKKEEAWRIERARQQEHLEKVQRGLAAKSSQELQGEVLEETITRDLKAWFPLDGIISVKKGARGADVVQAVMDRDHGEAGRIVYESKNAATFQPKWLGKLREDMVEHNALFAILVTQHMPKELSDGTEDFVFADDPAKSTVMVTTPKNLRSVATTVRRLLLADRLAVSGQMTLERRKEELWKAVNSPRFRGLVANMNKWIKGMTEDIAAHKRHNERFAKSYEKRLEQLASGALELDLSTKDYLDRPLLGEAETALDDGAEFESEDDE